MGWFGLSGPIGSRNVLSNHDGMICLAHNRMASNLKSLRLLADERRLRLLLLSQRKNLTVGEIQEVLRISGSRIFMHLGEGRLFMPTELMDDLSLHPDKTIDLVKKWRQSQRYAGEKTHGIPDGFL